MVIISKIEFDNVTILYDEEKVNKKICKRKNRLMNLWCVISAFIISFIIFMLIILCSLITYNKMSEILSILLILILFGVLELGLLSMGYWFVYHKNIKAFLFIEWMFRIKNIYAGWYNNKILLRVKYSNGIDDYSLQGFVRSIKNELEITDKSDRSKPIHIYIDITNDKKTNIKIENIE